MAVELGEVREKMAQDCWAMAERIAHDRSKDVKPFYIIYSAKVDPALVGSDVRGQRAAGGIRQCFRLSYDRPPFVLGMLVWFINNPLGEFRFVPELSSAPDSPVDPSLLSHRSEDQSYAMMDKAKEMNKVIPLVS
jgi:hypothetical protein